MLPTNSVNKSQRLKVKKRPVAKIDSCVWEGLPRYAERCCAEPPSSAVPPLQKPYPKDAVRIDSKNYPLCSG